MTDHHAHDSHDPAVDDWLMRYQRTQTDALDGVLDIEAGLREVLIHSRHDTAVDTLDSVLDPEAGLAAILPAAAPQSLPASTVNPADAHASAELFLRTVSPAARMTLRNHPTVTTASANLARDRLNDTSWKVLEFNLARDLVDGLVQDLHLARSRTPAISHGLLRAQALADAINLAFDHESRVSAHSVARDLARDLAHEHALDHGHDHGFALVLDRARTRARDLIRAVYFGVSFEDVIEIRTNEVCRAIGMALRCKAPIIATDSVRTVLDDFTDTDLRSADLTDIDLSGVRWSRRTQWPPAMDIDDLRVRSDETPPGSGTWIVRSGTATIRDHVTFLR